MLQTHVLATGMFPKVIARVASSERRPDFRRRLNKNGPLLPSLPTMLLCSLCSNIRVREGAVTKHAQSFRALNFPPECGLSV